MKTLTITIHVHGTEPKGSPILDSDEKIECDIQLPHSLAGSTLGEMIQIGMQGFSEFLESASKMDPGLASAVELSNPNVM